MHLTWLNDFIGGRAARRILNQGDIDASAN
jgi:hypothetical protein